VKRLIKGKVAKKHARKVHAKKANAATGMQQTGEIPETRESSKKEGKKRAFDSNESNSIGSSKKAPMAKRAPKKLTLDNAINQTNLFSKSKLNEVEVIYKTLEDGLGICSPYGHEPILKKISAERIYLLPNMRIYRVYIEK
jgi:hypothetical protein